MDEFEFGLFDEQDILLVSGTNDANGLVQLTYGFPEEEAHYEYILEEIDGPAEWQLDDRRIPVHIDIIPDVEPGEYFAKVEYPESLPGFRNTKDGEDCSLIEFEEQCFDAPGTYTFTIRETSQSGGGWIIDDSEFDVIVTVEDDGFGNLVVTNIEYPQGFPEFENTYQAEPICVVISARKRAIGAELPCGRFEFGLFDESGVQVATARNE
ncbi:MAG: hypothetical protein LBE35_02950 [Clostridiales bacterium]|nr:hypothetical protein [Clostridiales bacterium]